uniref:Peroxiredoxin-like 2A n=1 Tax=Knipowitschia caucasica TaxID=637954 RepID=A0AAV2LC87_KNICA
MATVAGFVTTVMNFLTDPFLTSPLKATLKHLEETELSTLQGEKSDHGCEETWMIFVQRGGCRAEDVGTEALNFKPFFKGEIFLDEKRRFYGPRERRMGLLAFLRVGVWTNGMRAFTKGFAGNVFGEGFVLGGVFVIGRGQQGILLEHREIEFGDKVNIKDVIEAVRRMPRELQPIQNK